MPATHNAFISGAGRNIGRAVAMDLARRGCNVVVNGSSNRANCDAVAAQVKALGVEAAVLMGDVGDPEEAKRMAAEALAPVRHDRHPRQQRRDPAASGVSGDQRRRLASGHRCRPQRRDALRPRVSARHVCARLGPHLQFHRPQRDHGQPRRRAYLGGEARRLGSDQALAREYGPKGVTVNAISPGPIAADGEDLKSPRRASAIARVPLGRQGANEEIAAVCGMLCSEEGSYVSGQMIAVSGGGVT